MRINSISNQSFGKLYAEGSETIQNQLNKIKKNPKAYNIAIETLPKIDKFEYFDMYIYNNGDVTVKEKAQNGLIKEFTDGYIHPELMYGISFICENEALKDIKEKIKNGDVSDKNVEVVFNKALLAGKIDYFMETYIS